MCERTEERRIKYERGEKERDRREGGREGQRHCCRIISREYTGSEEKRDNKHAARRVTAGRGRQGTGSEGAGQRRGTRRGGETTGRDSWFTCRHGNAASPLTCYSIGIARPSAAVLSQPPQKYEHESRSIAWDRE